MDGIIIRQPVGDFERVGRIDQLGRPERCAAEPFTQAQARPLAPPQQKSKQWQR